MLPSSVLQEVYKLLIVDLQEGACDRASERLILFGSGS